MIGACYESAMTPGTTEPTRTKKGGVSKLFLAVSLTGAVLAGCLNRNGSETAVSDGFVPLFDGRTLAGWRGDPAYWSVRDGAITGGSMQDIPANTFLIHEGSFRNFELRFKYRFPVPGNSGVNIRSRLFRDFEFEVTGYQANVVTVPPSSIDRYANIHEHNGRPTLAALGERTVYLRRDGEVRREVLGILNAPGRILAADRTYPNWNEQAVIAYENRIINVVNGFVAADTTDNDQEGRSFDGFIALQVHGGPPMEVQFADIELRPLTAPPELSGRFQFESTP